MKCIDTITGVCGGEPIIVRTRIPVWVLEQARRLGSSETDLLRSYSALRAEDLANAWAYVRSHRDQIDVQIHKHETARAPVARLLADEHYLGLPDQGSLIRPVTRPAFVRPHSPAFGAASIGECRRDRLRHE